jgi:site-specific DNA-methyltransferase (adenine-specific)
VKPYYSEGGITIYHGDCAAIAPALGLTFDLLCTDPPYGLDMAKRQKRRRNRGGDRPGPGMHSGRVPLKQYAGDEWDRAVPSQDLLDLLRSMCQRTCIFGGNYFTLPPMPSWLVWDKCNGASDYADAEMAWTDYGIPLRLKRYRWNGMLQEDMSNREERVHPTQKPLAVMSWSISLCPERPSSVFDPFMGSGTTLRAAKDLGIRAVGIDAEERYCEIAAQRLAQGVLFGGVA